MNLRELGLWVQTVDQKVCWCSIGDSQYMFETKVVAPMGTLPDEGWVLVHIDKEPENPAFEFVEVYQNEGYELEIGTTTIPKDGFCARVSKTPSTEYRPTWSFGHYLVG